MIPLIRHKSALWSISHRDWGGGSRRSSQQVSGRRSIYQLQHVTENQIVASLKAIVEITGSPTLPPPLPRPVHSLPLLHPAQIQPPPSIFQRRFSLCVYGCRDNIKDWLTFVSSWSVFPNALWWIDVVTLYSINARNTCSRKSQPYRYMPQKGGSAFSLNLTPPPNPGDNPTVACWGLWHLTSVLKKPWKHYAMWKKSVTKDHILYDSIYMKCPE